MILINPCYSINHFKTLAFWSICAAIILSNTTLTYTYALFYHYVPAAAITVFALSMAAFYLFTNSQLIVSIIYLYLLLNATERYRQLNNLLM